MSTLGPGHLFLFLGCKNHVARLLLPFFVPDGLCDSRPVSGSLWVLGSPAVPWD